MFATERQSNALLFGISPRVSSLPAGHSSSVVAVLGDGVSDAAWRYGALLRSGAPVSSRVKLPDPTLQSLCVDCMHTYALSAITRALASRTPTLLTLHQSWRATRTLAGLTPPWASFGRSAWTDNGAYYFWNSAGAKVLPRPAIALPAWLASLRPQWRVD